MRSVNLACQDPGQLHCQATSFAHRLPPAPCGTGRTVGGRGHIGRLRCVRRPHAPGGAVWAKRRVASYHSLRRPAPRSQGNCASSSAMASRAVSWYGSAICWATGVWQAWRSLRFRAARRPPMAPAWRQAAMVMLKYGVLWSKYIALQSIDRVRRKLKRNLRQPS